MQDVSVTSMKIDLSQLGGIVLRIAQQELLPRFDSPDPRLKADGSLVTSADYAVQSALEIELCRQWPDIALAGEEGPDDLSAGLLSSPWVWCIDPLDGTTNFCSGLPFFAVSIALLHEKAPVAAAIYDPCRDELFTAYKGVGAWLNGEPLKCTSRPLPLGNGVGVVDFKRLTGGLAAKLALSPPYASQRSFGSVALDWCWLAAGRFDVYLHGMQKVWDYAAGTLILSEAGGYSSTLTGETVFSPMFSPRSVIAAGDRATFEAWREWVRVASQSK